MYLKDSIKRTQHQYCMIRVLLSLEMVKTLQTLNYFAGENIKDISYDF